MAETTIPKVYKSLMTLQGLIQVVSFDATNPHFKNRYASLAGIVKSIAPHMQIAGLCFTQTISELVLTTRLICAADGSEIVSTLALPVSANATSQMIGAAITYIKRYALCAILGIVGDDEDDGNTLSITNNEAKDLEIKNLQSEISGLKAVSKKQIEEATSKLWAEFTSEPILDNRNRIANILTYLAPEKVESFTQKADAQIKLLPQMAT